MYVVVQHEIDDPGPFWEAAQAGMQNLPADLTLHQLYPNANGTMAACLWEADAVDRVKEFLEPAVSDVSSNDYFALDAEHAVGLAEGSS